MEQIINSLSQLGIAAVTFGIAFYIFYKFYMRVQDSLDRQTTEHRAERLDWYAKQEKKDEHNYRALEDLTREIKNSRRAR